MAVANTVIEVADHLGVIGQRVASIARHLRVTEFARVLVTVVKSDQALAAHEAFTELALINAIVVVKHSEAVQEAISELAFVLQLVVCPKVHAFSVELGVLEFTFVVVSV